MVGIVLASGLGKRLRPITENIPKPLVEVCDKRLIDYQIEFLSRFYLDGIIVVGGYKYHKLREYLFSNYRNEVVVLENKEFELGNICTINLALSYIEDPRDIIIMNSDHIYEEGYAYRLKECMEKRGGILPLCDFDRELFDDDMKVLLDGKKRLKAIAKDLKEYTGGYVGMTYISKDHFRLYKAVITSLYNKDKRLNLEYALGVLCKDVDIYVCDTSGLRFYEIDTIEDYEKAKERLCK
jgi:choline kinase